VISRLQYDDKGQRDYRAELDSSLDVASWATPLTTFKSRQIAREPGAPSWWHGEEEASESFLRAMGVNLDA